MTNFEHDDVAAFALPTRDVEGKQSLQNVVSRVCSRQIRPEPQVLKRGEDRFRVVACMLLTKMDGCPTEDSLDVCVGSSRDTNKTLPFLARHPGGLFAFGSLAGDRPQVTSEGYL